MDDDLAIVERQLGRKPRAFRRVAVRCPYGAPAVVEQTPFDEAGEPFPTQFWLTCRHLATAISRIEAAGGVERWTDAAEAAPELRAILDRAHAEQQELRPELALDDLEIAHSMNSTGGVTCSGRARRRCRAR